MKEKVKQYRNLILTVVMILCLAVLLLTDPVGFFTQRAHVKAQIENQIAIEKAETEKQIAIIKAQTIAEQMRIREEAGISVAVLDNGISDIREPISQTAKQAEEPETALEETEE